MGFLESIENRIEQAVNNLFSKTARSELQPVQIVEAVRNAMDTAASQIDRDRVLVPHSYFISVSANDYPKMSEGSLISAIQAEAAKHAARQGYRTSGDLVLKLNIDSRLGRGHIRVEASAANPTVSWRPALLIGERRIELSLGTTTIGRDSSADIAVDDRGLSRIHFEIAWNGEVAALRDRMSTNGTFVGGMRVNELVLHSGSRINAGRSEFEFELLALPKETNNE